MNMEDQCEELDINYGETDSEDSDPEDEEEEDVNRTDPFTGKKIDPAKDSSDSDSESDSWMRPWHEIYSWKSVKYVRFNLKMKSWKLKLKMFMFLRYVLIFTIFPSH